MSRHGYKRFVDCPEPSLPCKRIGKSDSGYNTCSNFIVGDCKIYNKCPMGKFNTIMQEVLGGEEFQKLMNEGTEEKVPDDVLIRRVIDALELKNKALFESSFEPTFMAIDKLNLVEAVSRYQGALRAAEAAVNDAPPDLAEEAAIGGAENFKSGFAEDDRSQLSKTYVLGYIGTTDLHAPPPCEKN